MHRGFRRGGRIVFGGVGKSLWDALQLGSRIASGVGREFFEFLSQGPEVEIVLYHHGIVREASPPHDEMNNSLTVSSLSGLLARSPPVLGERCVVRRSGVDGRTHYMPAASVRAMRVFRSCHALFSGGRTWPGCACLTGSAADGFGTFFAGLKETSRRSTGRLVMGSRRSPAVSPRIKTIVKIQGGRAHLSRCGC